jgi:ABC-2 type transport system ATP-binding protein
MSLYQPLIEFNGVSKIFNEALEKKAKKAVDSLSFSVDAGEITGFVGPNGAGKTTSIKMALGLLSPTSGSVKLMGKDAFLPAARNSVAYLSEQPYFYEHLSAEETLIFIHKMKKLSPSTRDENIKKVLTTVELFEHRKGRVKTFSKGMQQRLNMAQALLGDPKLIIMDEPMSGLDPLGRRLFRALFRQLSASGTTIFFSTHVIEDMENLCEKIIVLSKGKLHYSGSISELIKSSQQGVEFCFEEIDESQIPKILDFDGVTPLQKTENSIIIVAKDSEVSKNLFLFCAENSITPTAVEPYRKSLEDILYDNQGGVQ